MKAIELKNKIVQKLAQRDTVMGIGQTGSIDAVLVPGKSDIDLFVLCSEIPSGNERETWYSELEKADCTVQMEVCRGGVWGTGDVLVVDGIDVMPMYFTVQEMQDYLEEILACKHLEKDGDFYPVGRLSSISGITVLYEKENTWTKLKEMVNQKPDLFFRQWFLSEINQVIDEEDLGRSELRKEVLFYHQVLENALDHLLQALFAMNHCYFPSRKRTVSAIDSFRYKPENCCTRLHDMITWGASEDTIALSIMELRNMTGEVIGLGMDRVNDEIGRKI
jgi:hypothetical protein